MATTVKRYTARGVLILALMGLAIIDWENPGCSDAFPTHRISSER